MFFFATLAPKFGAKCWFLTMKRILFSLFLGVVCLTSIPCVLNVQAQEKAPTLAADDPLTPLQGNWEGVEKGKEDDGMCKLTITGNKADFQGAKAMEWYKATLQLNASTDPKQMDGTINDCPVPEMVGKVSKGIYKLEGDTLTLVGRRPGNPEGPKSFDGGEDARIFVLKKVAK